PDASVLDASPAWAIVPTIAPTATAGPSSRVTGSPQWLVRAQASAPPGGRRFMAEYASRAALAAAAPADTEAINRTVLTFLPFFSATRWASRWGPRAGW